MTDHTRISATDRLRIFIEARIAANEAQDEDGDAFIGIDDWQVTEAEAEVFMLHPGAVRRVGPVWDAYCNAIGADFTLSDELGDGMFDELRREHPFLDEAIRGGPEGGGTPYQSMAGFVRFGELLGIDHRTCVAWYWKVLFMMERREASGTL